MSADRNGYVDVRLSLRVVGSVLKPLSLAPLAPLVVALYYGESPLPFAAMAVVTFLLGAGLERLHPDTDVGHRETFLVVSLTWLVVPLVGTIPYLVAGQGTVADPVNALFESMSGFTTTGATVLGDISFETHSRSILFWRQLTQWFGGMGLLVLMIAILPELSVGGAQLMNEESPGLSIEKLTPRIRESAAVLWKIYVGFTLLAAATYYGLHLVGAAPSMDLYNAVSHALTTLPTGGFSPEARSAEAFAPAVQWAIMLFMIVAGANFALYWYALIGEPERLLHNQELRSYLGAMAAVGVLLGGLLFAGVGLATVPQNVLTLPGNLEPALRHGLFQAIAIVTTTGYASMDFNTWSQSAQAILVFAMFLGGSAGSAAGSVKIVRWFVVQRTLSRELYTTIHPEAVRPVRLSGEPIDESTIKSVFVFVMTFLLLFVFSTVLVFLDANRTGLELTVLEATSVAIATLGNVGPGVGLAGPMNSFLQFSDATKLYMVLLMWIGRLEVLSVLVIFTPGFWQR